MDNALVINPKQPATHLVVWLHGLGADGHDFEPIVPELRLPESLAVKFVFPHAPVRPITLNSGMRMRGWYDIQGMDIHTRTNSNHVKESSQAITQILENEIKNGIPAGNIILAGFSQGGLIALYTGLQFKEKLAGIIALSTYLPENLESEMNKSEENAQTEIFFGHGSLDPLVQPDWGRSIFKRLQAQGQPVSWQEYPMEHQVCMEEIEDLSVWLHRVWNLTPA